jgi:Ribbon-helix-helix protein, copG family
LTYLEVGEYLYLVRRGNVQEAVTRVSGFDAAKPGPEPERPETDGRDHMTNPTTEQARAAIEEEVPELRKVTISMPAWMLDDLRKRARQRGITVTELMRRAVSLERMLFTNPENEVILRDQTTGKETSIRLI